jgi:hypothetical protein
VCGLVRRQEIADISVALWRKYSAPHAGVRNAKRVAYLWSGGDSADAGIEYISPEKALISQQYRLLNQKKKSQKQQILQAAALSSNELRPESRGDTCNGGFCRCVCAAAGENLCKCALHPKLDFKKRQFKKPLVGRS